MSYRGLTPARHSGRSSYNPPSMINFWNKLAVLIFTFNPRREEVVVGHEVAVALLDVVNGLCVLFRKGADILVAEILTFGKGELFVGDIFAKDEAKDVIFVFVGLNFRPHLVGRFTDFRGKLLFIHSMYFLG